MHNTNTQKMIVDRIMIKYHKTYHETDLIRIQNKLIPVPDEPVVKHRAEGVACVQVQ